MSCTQQSLFAVGFVLGFLFGGFVLFEGFVFCFILVSVCVPVSVCVCWFCFFCILQLTRFVFGLDGRGKQQNQSLYPEDAGVRVVLGPGWDG